ncbi:hypothetical protein JTE90_013124, partial [Oedothorax gibbosus]
MFPFNQERKLEIEGRSDTALVITHKTDASQRSGCVPLNDTRAAFRETKAFGFRG